MTACTGQGQQAGNASTYLPGVTRVAPLPSNPPPPRHQLMTVGRSQRGRAGEQIPPIVRTPPQLARWGLGGMGPGHMARGLPFLPCPRLLPAAPRSYSMRLPSLAFHCARNWIWGGKEGPPPMRTQLTPHPKNPTANCVWDRVLFARVVPFLPPSSPSSQHDKKPSQVTLCCTS